MNSQNQHFKDAIIQKIKQLRTDHNISQLALSDILEISSGQVGNIESSRFQHKYTLKQIYTFCTHIGYPIENVFLTAEEISAVNHIDLLIQKIIEYDE